MPRTVFLSFLGATAYTPCNYFPEGDPARKIENVSYIQEALLRLHSHDLTNCDRCYFFLTKLARKTNWLNNGQLDYTTKKYNAPHTGLRQRLREMKGQGTLLAGIVPKGIPDGFSSEEIWEIFLTVFSCLKKGDKVIIDITHAFRSLPMLGMVLISYAKAIREIEVEAIYYGAFEKLGPAAEVREVPVKERNAPILNLTSFSELQDWAAAAQDFVHYGNPQRWNTLTASGLSRIDQDSGAHSATKNLSAINQKMQQLAGLIKANRGGALHQFSYDAFKSDLDDFSENKNLIKPLSAIVEVVKEKLAPFSDNDHLKWLEQVEWCLKHELWQQGITQLQEGFLTWLCNYFEARTVAPSGFFNWKKTAPRNLLSSALNLCYKPQPESEWAGHLKNHLRIVRRIMQFDVIREMAEGYSKLGHIRNDINHGGYTGNTPADRFAELLDKYTNAFKTKLKDHYETYQKQGFGLLNLSNHPSEKWPDLQLQTARKQFGSVEDLPFPAIDPFADPNQLNALARTYFESIEVRQPAAIHLMEEMTFTNALVPLLKEAGIPCIASTSERIVTEEKGKKVVQFQFVQFRPY